MNREKAKNMRILILLLGGLAAIGPFSIDMYLPGFDKIAISLNTSMAMVGYSLTAYFIGICFGQLVFGPISDRYGRKKPLLAGLALYVISSVGCIYASSIYQLIALRAVQAVGGCVGMVAGRAIVRDIFPISLTAKIFSNLMLVMGVAPIIAPTAGGFITSAFGWRYVFVTLSIFGSFMFITTLCFLKESKTPDLSISLKPRNILINYFGILKNHEFIIFSFASGALSCGFFAYIAGSAFVFMKILGMSETQFGWLYALNACALIIGSQLNGLLLKKFKVFQICVFTAAFQLITALCLIKAAYNINVSHIPIYILMFIFLLLCGVLSPNTTALALSPITKSAGSASAMIGFIQMFSGTLATCFVNFLHDGTIFPMMIVMSGSSFIGVTLLLSYKLFFEYSKKIINTSEM